jgi:DNA repair exonuclease SbcCD ATPase subunit
LLRGRRPLYIIAGLLLISLGATWLSHHVIVGNLDQTQSRISNLEVSADETMREIKRLTQVANTVDMLYLQVRDLRTTSRNLNQRIHSIASELPENGELTRLPGHVRHIDNQLANLEKRIHTLGEGFNMAEMQQIIGQMKQRVADINGQTETLIHHVADSVDAPWPDRLLSEFAGRGGAESPAVDQDQWAINLMPLDDRLQAEMTARSIGEEGLTVMIDEHNKEYKLRVVGFQNPGGAREYLLSNLDREVFNGAWLSKWE